MKRTKNLCYYVDMDGNLTEEPLQDMKTVYVDLIHDLRYELTFDRSDYFPEFNGGGTMLPMDEYFDVFFCPSHFWTHIIDKVEDNKKKGEAVNLQVVFRRIVYKSHMQHYPRLIRDIFNDGYGLYIKEKDKEIYEQPESVPDGKVEDINILHLLDNKYSKSEKS